MRKSLGIASLVVALALSFAPKVDAALILAVEINGQQFCATDNDSLCSFGTQLSDQNLALGVLSLDSTTIGGVTVEGSIHRSIFGPPTNTLRSSSLTITNTLGTTANIQASIGATDFVYPSLFATTTGSGTWGTASQGSSLTYTYYYDAANNQGGDTATDRPGLLLDTFMDTALIPDDSFDHDGGPFPINALSAFSMTLGFDMTLLGFDSLDSRGQAMSTDVQAVPEPMSMFLLGTGLVGGGYLRRRQKKA
jgi:hypothetical protein